MLPADVAMRPSEATNKYFNRAADQLEIAHSFRTYLITPRRELRVQIPVEMDNGELRSFLDQQRRSTEPMSWVNLACQHLPITATARQKLLESAAPERCLKISRGLDALLRKEQGA